MANINTYLTGICLFVMLLVHVTFVPVVQAGDGVVVHYTGPIDSERNHEFFSSIRGKQVRRLVITSSGGEVEAAIDLGSWVFDNKIDVEVPEYCLSSCANYVFPAGRAKWINEGAIVAWHGNYHHLKITGLWQGEVDRKVQMQGMEYNVARRNVLAQVSRLVRLEREFYQKIGVSEFICWIGKVSPFNISDYYFLSWQDMQKFGVGDVTVPDDYERTDVSDFTVSISYIRLH